MYWRRRLKEQHIPEALFQKNIKWNLIYQKNITKKQKYLIFFCYEKKIKVKKKSEKYQISFDLSEKKSDKIW